MLHGVRLCVQCALQTGTSMKWFCACRNIALSSTSDDISLPLEIAHKIWMCKMTETERKENVDIIVIRHPRN